VLYLDSSALVKLAITEAESASLRRWLAERPHLVLVSSSLVRAEVPRTVWRADPSALPEAYQVIRRTTEIQITDGLLTKAASVRPAILRTLGALHLASALILRADLTAFVAYDQRLLAAARDAGLPVASPA